MERPEPIGQRKSAQVESARLVSLSPPPAMVNHYTDLRGLGGIIRTRTIRASEPKPHNPGRTSLGRGVYLTTLDPSSKDINVHEN